MAELSVVSNDCGCGEDCSCGGGGCWLGDVVAVELPEEGDKVVKGEVFGSVESVKAVSDLFAPVSGTVSRVNTPLNDSPEYVNEDPFDEGWLIEVEMSDPEEADELMDAAAYAEFVAEQD